MNRSLIALLLNAFVFPGAGHVYLKHTGRGMLFLLPALAALLVLGERVLDTVNDVTGQVADGRIPLDVTAIATEVSRQGTLHGGGVNALSLILLACWAGSMLDGWWLARR